MHQETASSHFPLAQDFEQHSPSLVQSLPAVLQLSFSGSHVFSGPQVPPQHSESLEQSSPSETHALFWHTEPLQFRLQQSVGALQPAPGAPHATIADSQEFVLGLHVPEQHSFPPVQSSPNALQVGPPPALPASPEAPPALDPDSPEAPPFEDPPLDEPPDVDPPVDIWPASPDPPPDAEDPPEADEPPDDALPLPPVLRPAVPPDAELPPVDAPALPAAAPAPGVREVSFPPQAAATAMVKDTRARTGRTFIGYLGARAGGLRTPDRLPKWPP